jgi:hypothetical protein
MAYLGLIAFACVRALNARILAVMQAFVTEAIEIRQVRTLGL